MRAAVVTAMNGPWEVQNVPEPKPGPNQVLVKMHASGVCYTDVHETLGHLPGVFPRILGHEPVGEIVSVGPGVRTRKVGDRVAGYTVWSGLRWANPKPHERVAILGIGGLGHLAVQYAKAAGFETIAISHSPDKDKMIRELGADEIVRDGKGLAAAGGADILLSTSNSTKAMVDSVQGLRPDGRLVTMGADAEPLAVSLRKNVRARASTIRIGRRLPGPTPHRRKLAPLVRTTGPSCCLRVHGHEFRVSALKLDPRGLLVEWT
jgi:D-arabinose 1-dehydrogenase-like Zn-dependent alcohol dehydrogenase